MPESDTAVFSDKVFNFSMNFIKKSIMFNKIHEKGNLNRIYNSTSNAEV